ncbi:IS66 family insertion sequence element accessory protein TnpB [Escherichia coli]|nr:IS66 family insertion sequence element accessory protein TnpB [Escherichia coli]MXE64301.1 IS66 family insertion sequence element accessory protein TnpB [Escherichia coli]
MTLNAAALPQEPLEESPETLGISGEVMFRFGTPHLNGTVSKKSLTLLIQELKRCSCYLPGLKSG